MSVLRPDALRSADYVVFDTTLPRHLATLGAPYLQSLRVLFGERAVIPRAVEMELRQAARLGHASSAQALIGRQGILRTIRLDPNQVVRAQRLRENLPAKGWRPDPAGEARFQAALAQWRASMAQRV